MASNSRITVTVVDSKLNRTEEEYLLAHLQTEGKAIVSITLSQVTPKGEKVLSVVSLAAQLGAPAVQHACSPAATYRHQLMSLVIVVIMAHFRTANRIQIVVETDDRYEVFRMCQLHPISHKTLEQYVLPRALQMLGENLLEPTAVSQCYLRADYEVSFTVGKGKASLARHFIAL